MNNDLNNSYADLQYEIAELNKKRNECIDTI